MDFNIEQMNIVIVGHVDHGKSTVIGRLLADTNSLPEGKLEQVKRNCELNAKPFEYAFLLDALKDEQAQGITIDVARCFFKTAKRNYIIIDAPGHIEFLKNMITGAARAEAALLVIDANEGVQENSRRHGYMLSLLGIKQIIVLVNKMDLVNYNIETYQNVVNEYSKFLKEIGVSAKIFIPVAARNGDNIAKLSANISWYKGNTVLAAIDNIEKEKDDSQKHARFPVQDIYKFTEENDDRRIIAGTVETGTFSVNDEVIFLPSMKKTRIMSIEAFNEPRKTAVFAGYAAGFTLDTQIYIKPGELMCKITEKNAQVGDTFKANIFWLGKQPMIKNKKYKIKIATLCATVYLKEIINALDASDLTTEKNKAQIDRHDVAECVFQTVKPVAFDISTDITQTGRFVIIDNYEISGGGIILENLSQNTGLLDEYIKNREISWVRSNINSYERSAKFKQKPQFIIVTGVNADIKLLQKIAKTFEQRLFESGRSIYYLGLSNLLNKLNKKDFTDRDEQLIQLGELAYAFTDSGQIFISTIPELDDYEIKILETLNKPNEIIVINVGNNKFNDYPVALTIELDGDINDILQSINQLLQKKEIIEYYL